MPINGIKWKINLCNGIQMLIQGYLVWKASLETQGSAYKQLKCCELCQKKKFGFHFHFIPHITLAFMRLVSFDVRWFS